MKKQQDAEEREKLKPIKNELERLYNYINNKHKLDLPPIVIHNESQGRSKYIKGWCKTNAWRIGRSKFCEINICSEFLNKPFESCEILLHEITHLTNITQKIKDTSRGGSYHNINFKKTAEKLGLNTNPKYSNQVGFGITSLSKESKRELESKFELKREVFNLVRLKGDTQSRTLTKIDNHFYVLSSYYEDLIKNPDIYLNELSKDLKFKSQVFQKKKENENDSL